MSQETNLNMKSFWNVRFSMDQKVTFYMGFETKIILGQKTKVAVAQFSVPISAGLEVTNL